MANFFVPYSGKKPAALSINGHRLVILSRERELAEESLNLLGASSVRKFRVGEGEDEESRVLSRLAVAAKAGVVVAPSDIQLGDMIKNLENQLPWVQ